MWADLIATIITRPSGWAFTHTQATGVGKAEPHQASEIVDSVSGNQLGAVIQGAKGFEFQISPFSTINDVKDVIDKWTETAVKRMDELKEGTPAT